MNNSGKPLGSKLFRDILRAYRRHDGLKDAWAAWQFMASKLGSERELYVMIRTALFSWQGDMFAAYGWNVAPQLARYILGCRWEDEAEITSVGLPRTPAVLYDATVKS